jgi:hypothetical protein
MSLTRLAALARLPWLLARVEDEEGWAARLVSFLLPHPPRDLPVSASLPRPEMASEISMEIRLLEFHMFHFRAKYSAISRIMALLPSIPAPQNILFY